MQQCQMQFNNFVTCWQGNECHWYQRVDGRGGELVNAGWTSQSFILITYLLENTF